MEDEEALESSTVVSQLPDPVQDQVHNLLAHGVVTPGVVVSGVLLAGDHLLGVEELPVGPGTDLVNDGGLQIQEDSPGHVLAGPGLAEEGAEGVIRHGGDGLVTGQLAVRLDAVLHAVELPAGVAHLDSSLTDVNGDTFSHLVFAWL